METWTYFSIACFYAFCYSGTCPQIKHWHAKIGLLTWSKLWHTDDVRGPAMVHVQGCLVKFNTWVYVLLMTIRCQWKHGYMKLSFISMYGLALKSLPSNKLVATSLISLISLLFKISIETSVEERHESWNQPQNWSQLKHQPASGKCTFPTQFPAGGGLQSWTGETYKGLLSRYG